MGGAGRVIAPNIPRQAYPPLLASKFNFKWIERQATRWHLYYGGIFVDGEAGCSRCTKIPCAKDLFACILDTWHRFCVQQMYTDCVVLESPFDRCSRPPGCFSVLFSRLVIRSRNNLARCGRSPF